MNSVENVGILMKILEDQEHKSGRYLDRGHPLHLVSSETASVWAVIGIRSCYSITTNNSTIMQLGKDQTMLSSLPPPPVKQSPATHYL